MWDGEEAWRSQWLAYYVVKCQSVWRKRTRKNTIFTRISLPSLPYSRLDFFSTSSSNWRPVFCQNLIHTHIETTMKPWALLLIILICGVVMLLPVLGGIRKKPLCRWRGKGGWCSAQAWGVWHTWFWAWFPGSPFKGSEPSLKQRHPRKIRLDVPNMVPFKSPLETWKQ